MTAEEMFEKMGFIKEGWYKIGGCKVESRYEDDQEYLAEHFSVLYYGKEKGGVQIRFEISGKFVNIRQNGYHSNVIPGDIDRKLLKAIDKQFEELGW